MEDFSGRFSAMIEMILEVMERREGRGAVSETATVEAKALHSLLLHSQLLHFNTTVIHRELNYHVPMNLTNRLWAESRAKRALNACHPSNNYKLAKRTIIEGKQSACCCFLGGVFRIQIEAVLRHLSDTS